MGTSTNAYLLYGYDLGGGEDSWKIQGLGEYEDWEPDWLDEDQGIEESVAKRLREAAGFTETDRQADGYFDRKRAIDAQIGVTVESHCSTDYPMYVLAAAQLTARRGDVKTVDVSALLAAESLNARLDHALDVLGFRPIQEKPAWLLCSYWG